MFPCLQCAERGLLEATLTIALEIPPGAGGLFEVPLETLGIGNFVLRAFVRVRG